MICLDALKIPYVYSACIFRFELSSGKVEITLEDSFELIFNELLSLQVPDDSYYISNKITLLRISHNDVDKIPDLIDQFMDLLKIIDRDDPAELIWGSNEEDYAGRGYSIV